MSRLSRAAAGGALACLILAGCTTTPLRIPSESIRHDEISLGAVDGSASSIVLFGFIPLGENDRFADAYQRALAQRPADRLIDISMYESSWWAYIVSGHVVHVTATAIHSIRSDASSLTASR